MSRRGRRAALGLATAVAGLAIAPGRAAAELDLELYGRVLEARTRASDDVAGTRVDYGALQASPDWQRLLAGLAVATPPGASAPRAERLAFWINAYNVLAIDVVVRNWPLESIRDAGSLLRPVWKRPAGRVGGRAISLDEVEHGILRPLGDPRIHAAIVCASTSCPSLRREPYRPDVVDAQLDDAMARFLADRRKGLRVEDGAVRLSRIFSWFREDFEAAGGVLAFVRRHADSQTRAALDRLGPDPERRSFDYDWAVNGTP